MNEKREDHYQRYVIVGMLRSGTTVTHHCLRGHPNVSALTSEVGVEPFFSQGVTLFSFGQGATDHERTVGHRVLFDAAAGINADAHTMALGMKLAIATPRLACLLTDALRTHLPDVRVILTIREDLVAQYASLERARGLGRWHAYSNKAQAAGEKVELHPQDVADYVLDGLTILTELRSLAETHDTLLFSYERDIDRAVPLASDKLFDFLSLPQVEVDWLRSKKMSPPPQEYIEGYAEMRSLVGEIEKLHQAGASTEVLRRRFGRPPSYHALAEAQRSVMRVGRFLRRLVTSPNPRP